MTGWVAQTPAKPRDPRVLGLATGAVVIGYAVFLGAIRAGFIRVPGSGSGDIGPSDADLGALWLTVAFALPGVIAAIAAVRRSGPLLITAGILCICQAFIAFSGVALPFVVPAIFLVALGAATAPGLHQRRAMLAGLGVFVLVLAGWVTALGLTETRCWTATEGPNGNLVYTDVPATNEMLYGESGVGGSVGGASDDPTEVASGCDGGSPTAAGLGLGFLFALTAVALTAWGSRPDPPHTDEGVASAAIG
jgi:hypothetical protein